MKIVIAQQKERKKNTNKKKLPVKKLHCGDDAWYNDKEAKTEVCPLCYKAIVLKGLNLLRTVLK